MTTPASERPDVPPCVARAAPLRLALAALDGRERRRVLGALDTAARQADDRRAHRLAAAWRGLRALVVELLDEDAAGATR